MNVSPPSAPFSGAPSVTVLQTGLATGANPAGLGVGLGLLGFGLYGLGTGVFGETKPSQILGVTSSPSSTAVHSLPSHLVGSPFKHKSRTGPSPSTQGIHSSSTGRAVQSEFAQSKEVLSTHVDQSDGRGVFAAGRAGCIHVVVCGRAEAGVPSAREVEVKVIVIVGMRKVELAQLRAEKAEAREAQDAGGTDAAHVYAVAPCSNGSSARIRDLEAILTVLRL
jgi:hypothetical protein